MRSFLFFFFFNDTATTEIYTLSLHDALPISSRVHRPRFVLAVSGGLGSVARGIFHHPTRCRRRDRKSTRLNSSHSQISYAVFCLKKKTHYDTPLPLLYVKNRSLLHCVATRIV